MFLIVQKHKETAIAVDHPAEKAGKQMFLRSVAVRDLAGLMFLKQEVIVEIWETGTIHPATSQRNEGQILLTGKAAFRFNQQRNDVARNDIRENRRVDVTARVKRGNAERFDNVAGKLQV